MKEDNWVMFIEVYGRTDAELVESYLKAHGIETELIQDSIERFANPVSQSRVKILVPGAQLKKAQKLYDQSGWDFEIREDDEDDE